MAKDEKPMTADDIPSALDESYHNAIRTMLQKHEHIWPGERCEIATTEHHIDLVMGARALKYLPYQVGPKNRFGAV